MVIFFRVFLSVESRSSAFSLYLNFCIYGFRWKLPVVTLKGCPYMGASPYRRYPGYVGHHHRGAGGAEPLQGVAGLLCSEAPTPSAPGECLLPGRSGRPEGSPELALFLQGVSPSSCSGATAGASGAQGCTQLCAGVCAPAHTQQRHISPVVVVPDLVQGGGYAMGGGEGQLSWGSGAVGFKGLPCCQRVGLPLQC